MPGVCGFPNTRALARIRGTRETGVYSLQDASSHYDNHKPSTRIPGIRATVGWCRRVAFWRPQGVHFMSRAAVCAFQP